MISRLADSRMRGFEDEQISKCDNVIMWGCENNQPILICGSFFVSNSQKLTAKSNHQDSHFCANLRNLRELFDFQQPTAKGQQPENVRI